MIINLIQLSQVVGVKELKELGRYFVAPETPVESRDYRTNVLTP